MLLTPSAVYQFSLPLSEKPHSSVLVPLPEYVKNSKHTAARVGIWRSTHPLSEYVIKCQQDSAVAGIQVPILYSAATQIQVTTDINIKQVYNQQTVYIKYRKHSRMFRPLSIAIVRVYRHFRCTKHCYTTLSHVNGMTYIMPAHH